jgi:hypothetical protein
MCIRVPAEHRWLGCDTEGASPEDLCKDWLPKTTWIHGILVSGRQYQKEDAIRECVVHELPNDRLLGGQQNGH